MINFTSNATEVVKINKVVKTDLLTKLGNMKVVLVESVEY